MCLIQGQIWPLTEKWPHATQITTVKGLSFPQSQTKWTIHISLDTGTIPFKTPKTELAQPRREETTEPAMVLQQVYYVQ